MKEINIAKGIGMLAILYIHLALANGSNNPGIVLAHQSFGVTNIGGFILPMFFIMAGFSFAKTKKSIKNEIRQKVLNLFLYFLKYFVITGAIFTVIELILQKNTILECLSALLCEFLTRATCQAVHLDLYTLVGFHNIFVVVWYVWVYMFAMLFFILLVKIPVKSLKGEMGILAGTGAASLVLYCVLPELPFELNIVPSMTFLMYAAQLVKKYKLYQKLAALNNVKKVLILAVMLVLGVYCLSFCSASWMSHGTFVNPYGVEGMENLPGGAIWFFAIFGSLLMTYWFIYMCRLIIKIPAVGNFIAYIGVNSLDTMLLHTFFAMVICEITGLVCGRCLSAGDTMTTSITLQCYFIFVLTVAICYFWPRLKMAVIKKVKLKNSK